MHLFLGNPSRSHCYDRESCKMLSLQYFIILFITLNPPCWANPAFPEEQVVDLGIRAEDGSGGQASFGSELFCQNVQKGNQLMAMLSGTAPKKQSQFITGNGWSNFQTAVGADWSDDSFKTALQSNGWDWYTESGDNPIEVRQAAKGLSKLGIDATRSSAVTYQLYNTVEASANGASIQVSYVCTVVTSSSSAEN